MINSFALKLCTLFIYPFISLLLSNKKKIVTIKAQINNFGNNGFVGIKKRKCKNKRKKKAVNRGELLGEKGERGIYKENYRVHTCCISK